MNDGTAQTLEESLPDDYRLVNCSRCRRVLAAPGQSPVAGLEQVAGTAYARPCCWRCLPAAMRQPAPPANTFTVNPTE
jgi:hypothetical protein